MLACLLGPPLVGPKPQKYDETGPVTTSCSVVVSISHRPPLDETMKLLMSHYHAGDATHGLMSVAIRRAGVALLAYNLSVLALCTRAASPFLAVGHSCFDDAAVP